MQMFNSPSVLTKELAVQQVPNVGPRLRLSSNFLNGFGFLPDTRIRMDVQGGRGVIRVDPNGPMKVYSRSYPRRKNNPREAVIETSNPALMGELVQNQHERLHFTMSQGRIDVRPVAPALFHIRKKFRTAESLSAFMALSSGLDAWAMRDAGFKLGAVLEYRPQEARDSNDLTETGVCTFLRNQGAAAVFNEDITTCDIDRIVRTVDRKVGAIAVLAIGLQCDDFSNAKSANLKRQEMAEFRPSSRELGYYATKLIEQLKPASVLIEQVPGWHGSESQAVLGAVLTRLGYFVQSRVLDAAEYGAFTKRKRCYFVASIFPNFAYPAVTSQNATPLRELLASELGAMPDVTDTSTIKAARESGRARFTSLDSCFAPTVLKSQARCTKDSLYFEENGRIIRPTIGALRTLHGIPGDLRLDSVSDEIAVEQIGQGIEFPLHRVVAASLYEHLAVNRTRTQQVFNFNS